MGWRRPLADYGFEYSDEEPEEEDVDIENQYYNAEGSLEDDDPQEALDGFALVISMESEKGEWCVPVESDHQPKSPSPGLGVAVRWA
jgi:hypothetical protein